MFVVVCCKRKVSLKWLSCLIGAAKAGGGKGEGKIM